MKGFRVLLVAVATLLLAAVLAETRAADPPSPEIPLVIDKRGTYSFVGEYHAETAKARIVAE